MVGHHLRRRAGRHERLGNGGLNQPTVEHRVHARQHLVQLRRHGEGHAELAARLLLERLHGRALDERHDGQRAQRRAALLDDAEARAAVKAVVDEAGLVAGARLREAQHAAPVAVLRHVARLEGGGGGHLDLKLHLTLQYESRWVDWERCKLGRDTGRRSVLRALNLSLFERTLP